MKYVIIAQLFFLPFLLQAQDGELDKIIDQLQFGQDSIETVFLWVADNIRYDVKMKNELLKSNRKGVSKKGNRNDYEKKLLKNVMASKKGVCQDYSILMNALLHRLGYESIIVTGYTRSSEGKIDYRGGHAWNAVRHNNEWRLYDATWAAGGLNNDGKFVKNYNAKWNNTSPEEMIKTHMPFDPIWQLLKNPVNYDDFKASKFNEDKRQALDYASLITAHLEKEEDAQAEAALARSKDMGTANSRVKKWQASQEREMDYSKKMNNGEQFQAISDDLNGMADQFNEYIDAKNNQFKGKKWSHNYANSFMDELKEKCIQHLMTFEAIKPNDANEKRFIIKSSNQLKKFKKLIESEAIYLLNESVKGNKK